MPKKNFTQELEGTRRRGRPRKRWKEEVESDLQVLPPATPCHPHQQHTVQPSRFILPARLFFFDSLVLEDGGSTSVRNVG
jgi:hypothetical protein